MVGCRVLVCCLVAQTPSAAKPVRLDELAAQHPPAAATGFLRHDTNDGERAASRLRTLSRCGVEPPGSGVDGDHPMPQDERRRRSSGVRSEHGWGEHMSHMEIPPGEALRLLMEGNERWVTGQLEHPH